ncbi:cyclin-like protein [Zopfochytrium polystomum]|nr:cyclin-like protein [Zopfochytrium polystomum]
MASFWESSHRSNWHFTRQQLQLPQFSLVQDLQHISLKSLMMLHIYYCSVILRLGRRLQIRQQVIATAIIYFKRFYVMNPLRHSDPLLVATTCTYLACKIEETPFHIKNFVGEMKNIFGGAFSHEPSHVAECEFYLLEDLGFHTMVFHPYRLLIMLVEDAKLGTSFLQTAWFVVNDCYKSFLPLYYPPHMLALGAVFFASTLDDHAKETASLRDWFARINVDVGQLMIISQEILDLYQALGEYNEDSIPKIIEQLNRSYLA